jgi:hypothetical protein
MQEKMQTIEGQKKRSEKRRETGRMEKSQRFLSENSVSH